MDLNGEVVQSFIAMNRYIVLPYEEVVKGISLITCISHTNETATWRKILKEANEALNKYPTTLEDDLEILEEDKSLTRNLRNCIMFRKNEKVVLHFLKDCAESIC